MEGKYRENRSPTTMLRGPHRGMGRRHRCSSDSRARKKPKRNLGTRIVAQGEKAERASADSAKGSVPAHERLRKKAPGFSWKKGSRSNKHETRARRTGDPKGEKPGQRICRRTLDNKKSAKSEQQVAWQEQGKTKRSWTNSRLDGITLLQKVTQEVEKG